MRDGFLVQQNQRRWASYRLAENSPQTDESSPHLDGDSRHLGEDSRQLGGDSPHFPLELLALAEPARRRAKLATAEMRKLITTVCADRWLTTKELGVLLNRDADNLQRRFLTALVREGKLELQFPGVPNRPDQAYRTKET